MAKDSSPNLSLEIHRAARETVTLAEQRFISKQADWTFDSAWQDMLNHATMKVCLIVLIKVNILTVILQVTDAESQKTVAEKEHQIKAAAFIEAETKVSP
jgi:SH3-domain binding protein 5